MIFSKHSKWTFFLFNLLAAVVILFITGYIVLSCLDNYTMHGHSIAVPAFQNLTPQEAEQLAKQKNLQVMVVDSVFDENALPGTVQEQYPLNGAKVKANRMIQLTVSAQNPEQILFPLLNNSPYRQTIQTLESLGFKIGNIEYAPSDFKNLVLNLKYKDADIVPGELIRKGVRIDIVLGDGNDETNYVTVPQLCGVKLRDAIKLLQENYLNLGQIIPDNSIKNDTDLNRSTVYIQTPPFTNTANVQAGSFVDLSVTRDTKTIEALDSLIVTE